MNILRALKESEGTMQRKLFLYMLMLVVIVFIAVAVGLSFVGEFNSTEKEYYQTLDMQLEVFEKDIASEFDHLAFMGIRLSESTTKTLSKYYKNESVPFDGTAVSPETIYKVQDALIDKLRQQLIQTDCSGAFIMLNTTIDTKQKKGADTKSGIYLQKSTFISCDKDDKFLLYRGNPDVAKSHNIMPHRKWKMEFQTDVFPDYKMDYSDMESPVHDGYRVTSAFVLPGTSEKAMLLTVPMVDDAGVVYGICGFEVSESYFKSKHSQPSRLHRLTCVLTEDNERLLDTDAGLSSGVQNGYYMAPEADLEYVDEKGNLTAFHGKETCSIGISKEISLHAGEDDHVLAVMIPKEDYSKEAMAYTIRAIVFLAMLVIMTICIALYFTRRFVSPILKTLEQVRTNEGFDVDSEIQEIKDLFAFLSEQDKEHEQALQSLELEKQQAEESYQKAQDEINRLAYSRNPKLTQMIINTLLKV